MPRYNPKQELEKRLAELQGSQAEARSPFDRGAAVLRGMDIGKHFEDIDLTPFFHPAEARVLA